MTKYQLEFTPAIRQLVAKYVMREGGRRKAWTELAATADPIDAAGLDLLDRVLCYDHGDRWSARQAMHHPFFDAVRERVHAEMRLRRGGI